MIKAKRKDINGVSNVGARFCVAVSAFYSFLDEFCSFLCVFGIIVQQFFLYLPRLYCVTNVCNEPKTLCEGHKRPI